MVPLRSVLPPAMCLAVTQRPRRRHCRPGLAQPASCGEGCVRRWSQSPELTGAGQFVLVFVQMTHLVVRASGRGKGDCTVLSRWTQSERRGQREQQRDRRGHKAHRGLSFSTQHCTSVVAASLHSHGPDSHCSRSPRSPIDGADRPNATWVHIAASRSRHAQLLPWLWRQRPIGSNVNHRCVCFDSIAVFFPSAGDMGLQSSPVGLALVIFGLLVRAGRRCCCWEPWRIA